MISCVSDFLQFKEINESTMNSTTVNNETSLQQLLPRSEGIVFGVAFILETFAIIIGNAIVIVVFTKNRQLRKRARFYLLINLAVADLLVGVTIVPLLVSDLARNFDLWEYKWTWQKFIVTECFNLFITFASLISLAMVSLERMYAILWPVNHRLLETRTYYVFIGLSWFLPLLPVAIDLAERHDMIPTDHFLDFWLSFTCFLLLTICISYVSIWIKMKFGRHSQHHVTTAQDRKLTVSLFIVTVVSLVTWLPSQALNVAVVWFRPLPYIAFIRLYYSFMLLLFANSLVNPIIYSFRMPQFRQGALSLVYRRSAERRMPLIERRNEVELINRQACAVISRHAVTSNTSL